MKNHQFTRRQFLQSTSILATAPLILPSQTWAAVTRPNERLTIGCIGMGKQGRGLLRGFLDKKDLQVVAVSDVDTTRRESARKLVEDFYAKQTPGNRFKSCGDGKRLRTTNLNGARHWPAGLAAAGSGRLSAGFAAAERGSRAAWFTARASRRPDRVRAGVEVEAASLVYERK